MEIALTFRDAQPVDLDALAWTGGAAHQGVLAGELERTWSGDGELVVGEVSSGVLVCCGAIRYDQVADAGLIWLLSVRDSWQGLGVGTALIAELEERIAARGLDWAQLHVEHNNPRALALYQRLGYRSLGTIPESWALDDGSWYVTISRIMRHKIGELSPDGRGGRG